MVLLLLILPPPPALPQPSMTSPDPYCQMWQHSWLCRRGSYSPLHWPRHLPPPRGATAISVVAVMVVSEQHGPLLPAASSKATLSFTQQWEVLDFANNDETLATKLNDNDLRAVFVCIDAVHKLKHLKVDGCYRNIRDVLVLESLRGSVDLEHMDLSLAQHENPHFMRVRALSVDAVVPILESIAGREGSAIRYIDLPQQNCSALQSLVGLNGLLRRYNQLLESRGSKCSTNVIPRAIIQQMMVMPYLVRSSSIQLL